MAWYNVFTNVVLRSPLHGLFSGSTLLVNYFGRKSGKPYSVPVNYLLLKGEYYILSKRNRVWWRNMRGGSAVYFVVKGQEIKVWVSVLEEVTDIVEELCTFFLHVPRQAGYFGVEYGEDGIPTHVSLAKMAQDWVVVKGAKIVA